MMKTWHPLVLTICGTAAMLPLAPASSQPGQQPSPPPSGGYGDGGPYGGAYPPAPPSGGYGDSGPYGGAYPPAPPSGGYGDSGPYEGAYPPAPPSGDYGDSGPYGGAYPPAPPSGGYGDSGPYGAYPPPPPEPPAPQGYDGRYPPPPPPGYQPGPDDSAQRAWDDRYAADAENWARDNCVRAHGDTTAGAVVGGIIGAVIGSGLQGRHDRGAGTVAGAAIGAVGGAAIAGSARSNATSPGCPPGYVVRNHAPAYVYGDSSYYYAAPAWYRPWVFSGGAWLYRPYPYHDWYYRTYRAYPSRVYRPPYRYRGRRPMRRPY